MVERIKARPHYVDIGLVGKYVGLHDAYLSVAEALRHAGYYHNTHICIHWIDSEEITAENVEEMLSGLDGILVYCTDKLQGEVYRLYQYHHFDPA